MNHEPLWTIESGDGSRLLYAAETLEAIMLAAAYIHEDFPGEDFLVFRAGEYDAQATLMAQSGMVA